MVLQNLVPDFYWSFYHCEYGNDDVKHMPMIAGKETENLEVWLKLLAVYPFFRSNHSNSEIGQKDEVKTFWKLTGSSSSLDKLSCLTLDEQTPGKDERQKKRLHDLSCILLSDKRLTEVSSCFYLRGEGCICLIFVGPPFYRQFQEISLSQFSCI